MTTREAIQKIIDLARAEVGYREKASNAMLDNKTANAGNANYTKYARDLDAAKYYNGIKQRAEWCDVFTDWVFFQAFGIDLGQRMLYQPPRSLGAGTGYSAQYFKKAGAWYSAPVAGDQIFFLVNGKIGHTGIVISVNDSSITTVEGNSRNAVEEKTYARNYSNIAGYGRPNWALVADTPIGPVPGTESVIAVPELAQGSKGYTVQAMQLLLIGAGYSCGKWGADGDFGTATRRAVKQYQQDRGLYSDGICGPLTWYKLING